MDLSINLFKCRFCKEGDGTDHLHSLGSVTFLHRGNSEFVLDKYLGLSVNGEIFFGESKIFSKGYIRNASIQFFYCERGHIFMETSVERKGVITRDYIESNLSDSSKEIFNCKDTNSSKIIQELL